MPYDFSYSVKEDDGNDYSRKEESDGEVTRGEYRVLLPDTRVMIVRYTADWKNGYNAEVSYEGEAVYPTTPAYKSNQDVAGEGIRPGYNYQPPRREPTTTRPPPPPPSGKDL